VRRLAFAAFKLPEPVDVGEVELVVLVTDGVLDEVGGEVDEEVVGPPVEELVAEGGEDEEVVGGGVEVVDDVV
jgi:hypothetical protein